MIRRFARDRRGNYALMTVITMVPLMGGVALAVDYSELVRQRQETLNALDAAGIATAQQIVSGATDDAAKAYAKDFFEANLNHVKPANTTLTVTLPSNNAGGGTLVLQAALKYHPYFLPAAAMLIGKSASDTEIDFTARSEIRLKNTLEVSLVLDNSGSMSTKGSGTGQQRMELLKTAATELVNTLALQAQQMKQVTKPVQFALVPFSASVNIGASNVKATWLDQDGISPVQHENFDWSMMYKDASPGYDANKYIEKVGDVYWKRGSGWGTGQNTKATRFSLYDDIMAQTRTCTKKRQNGSCQTYTYSNAQYEAWKGCVEARPYPYNDDDTTPTSSEPASLFVPMFAPDEAGSLFRDIDLDDDNDLISYSLGYSNNWWADSSDSLTVVKRQADMRKYFYVKPYNASAAPNDGGPNAACTTSAITPLQDVTTTEGLATLTKAINLMTPTGNTNVPEGLAWGWRTVSSNEPFTEGRSNSEKGNDKVVIVLTDGANTYSPVADTDYANNQSTYAAYGYTGLGYNKTSDTRMFMNTSVNKTTYTAANYTAALDAQMQTLCANAKNSNTIVMTVSLDLVDTKPAEKAAMAALKTCSSDSRFRKDPTDPTGNTPAKLYWNATGATLSKSFKEIADELSNLRIVS